MGMLARCPLNFFIVLGVLAPNCKKLYKDNFAMVKAKLFATLDPFAKIWPKTSFFKLCKLKKALVTHSRFIILTCLGNLEWMDN
jgi:hypothetical protein